MPSGGEAGTPADPAHPAHREYEDWIAHMSDDEYAVWLRGITELRAQERAEVRPDRDDDYTTEAINRTVDDDSP